MRRRTFLAGLGFAALQLAGCAAKLQTTPDYVLTYADNQPAGYPTTQGAQYFADLDTEKRLCDAEPTVATVSRAPVSYTHLDVYKRQVCGFAPQPASCKAAKPSPAKKVRLRMVSPSLCR